MGHLKVKIKIGELVIDGADKATARRIGNALEIELTRLIQNDGLPDNLKRQNHMMASLDGGTLPVHNTKDPAQTGISIARSVLSILGETK